MKRRGGIYGFQHRLGQAVFHSGLTQEELAKRVGVSRKTIAGYLNGDSIPDARNLATLGTVLDVSVDWLLYADTGRAPEWILQR